VVQEKTILVVDDEPEIVKSLSIRLRANGYKVLTAMDAFQATSVAINQEPDLVVLDIGMPAGGGHEVAKRLRDSAKTCATPIIFLTARSSAHDKQLAREASVDRFITKPYQPEMLLAVIEELVGGGSKTPV